MIFYKWNPLFFVEDIEPDRLKRDVRQLRDYLVERRLPIEQRELETIAENVIQNLLKVECKFLKALH